MPAVVAQNRFFQNAMRADFEDGDKPPRNSSGQQRQVRFPHSKKKIAFHHHVVNGFCNEKRFG